MTMTPEQQMQVNNALNNPGIQLALPQTIRPVTKTQYQVQRTQYDPEKLLALKTALATPRRVMSQDEIWANALANYPEAKSYTGGFGEEIISPWGEAMSSFARSFGSAYAAAKADEREKAEQAREDAIKAAQLDYEASKQNITDQTALDYIKYNDPTAKTLQQAQQEQQQKQAAVDALHELDDLARNGGIWSGNKSTDNYWLSKDSSKNIGRREQALSALLPLTNAIARASGGSGINTLGEMMAYLGIPENATSAQIEGALPGIIKKLGLQEEFYQMSPVTNNGMAF